MSNWQVSTLSEVADFVLGKMLDQAKNKGELRPYLANVNVRWGDFDLDGLREMRFEPREMDRYSLRYGDIVMYEGGEPGRCAIWKSREAGLMFQKALHRIRPYNCLDSSFLYYAFLNLRKSDGFATYFTGATIKHLPREQLAKVAVRFPEISTQRKIAFILSAYDDLIANNRRRITLLERMAEDIYREWFVRLRFPSHRKTRIEKGVPNGWQIKKLPEIAKITYGFPFQGDRFNSNGVGRPIIRIRNIPEASTSDFTDEVVDPKYIVRAGDLLIGMDGDFHMNHWLGPDAYLVQRSCTIKAENPLLDAYLAHAMAAPINHFQHTIVGATVGHLGAKHLNSIDILVPPDSMAPHLDHLNALLLQKLNLGELIRRAKATRDALLPRLISGKLAVDGLDICFPPEMAASLDKKSVM